MKFSKTSLRTLLVVFVAIIAALTLNNLTNNLITDYSSDEFASDDNYNNTSELYSDEVPAESSKNTNNSFPIPPTPIIILLSMSLVTIVGMIFVWTRNFIRVPPDCVMVIFGSKSKGGKPYRVVKGGGGAFVAPVIHSYKLIYMGSQKLEIDFNALSADSENLTIFLTAHCSPLTSTEGFESYLERGIYENSSIVEQTIESCLRRHIGEFEATDLKSSPQKTLSEVIDLIRPDLEELGMMINTLIITEVM